MNYSRWIFKGGWHIDDHKTPVNSRPATDAGVPAKIYLPIVQHIGAPAKPVVQKGDQVKLGQLVCEAQGFVSANIHASVSGKILGMEKRALPNGRWVDCLVIENDGLDTPDESMYKEPAPESLDAQGITGKIQAAGIVGLGGATFPTHVKYAPGKDSKKPVCIILNGIECEPFVSVDHRLMLDSPERILAGLNYLMRACGCPRGYIAVEDNKKDAYALLSKLAKNYPSIDVVLCKEKYPQGSEKQLVYSITGQEIPAGGLPLDVGVIVNNAGTAAAVADAVEYNKPIYQRLITVNGNGVKNPGNYNVRIGTLYEDVFKAAGGFTGPIGKIINGGPMMGFAVPNLTLPVIKNTTGLLAFRKDDLPAPPPERNCVRCARCLDACPMQLEPTRLMHAVKRKDWPEAAASGLASCLECGSCSYVCPAGIPLVQYFRLGKQYTMNKGQGAKNPDAAR